ncbi:Cobalt-zinc-cadmium resistance protein CzcC precursor [Caulifigura coniformis]|uniref:Cobalt-zinc-cadmium resistance protein CzcC n=1 Tax=Caulifigura coniformis TaxID=2527983 RepID=A0A517SLI6_9PLAN|nr:TolC family protein [Caulifigura coniformis]QDT56984.1 Cobalt-zinc-cadmium resistance protein CzcC precursor [Caulifigura coniformis]
MPYRFRKAVFLAGLSLSAGCATGRPLNGWVFFRDSQPVAEAPAAVVQSGKTPDEAPETPEVSLTSLTLTAPDVPADAAVTSEAGAENLQGSLSLATLESWALTRNPAIRQASASAYKAMGFRDQVGLAPNPTIGFFGEQIGDDGTDQYGAFVAQDFILGDKLRLNQTVLSHSVQAQLWEVESQRRRVITDVRLRFYEALAAQQRLDAATSFEKVLAEGVRVAEVRKDVAEGTQSEILLAKIQRSELQILRQKAGIAFDAAWKELAAIVGVRTLEPVSLEAPAAVLPETKQWEVVYQDIVARSPELKAAHARLCRAASNVERQQVQPIPNLELTAGMGHDLATDQQFGRVQAGLPVPLYNKNQGNIAAADAEYCRAQQDYRRVQLSLSARLARTAQEYDAARIALEKYEQEIVPQAAESLSLTEQGYAAGEFGFLQALTARRVFFEASLELINARRDLAQSAATIDGLLLSGGLDSTVDTAEDDGLRGQALSPQ